MYDPIEIVPQIFSGDICLQYFIVSDVMFLAVSECTDNDGDQEYWYAEYTKNLAPKREWDFSATISFVNIEDAVAHFMGQIAEITPAHRP